MRWHTSGSEQWPRAAAYGEAQKAARWACGEWVCGAAVSVAQSDGQILTRPPHTVSHRQRPTVARPRTGSRLHHGSTTCTAPRPAQCTLHGGSAYRDERIGTVGLDALDVAPVGLVDALRVGALWQLCACRTNRRQPEVSDRFERGKARAAGGGRRWTATDGNGRQRTASQATRGSLPCACACSRIMLMSIATCLPGMMVAAPISAAEQRASIEIFGKKVPCQFRRGRAWLELGVRSGLGLRLGRAA